MTMSGASRTGLCPTPSRRSSDACGKPATTSSAHAGGLAMSSDPDTTSTGTSILESRWVTSSRSITPRTAWHSCGGNEAIRPCQSSMTSAFDGSAREVSPNMIAIVVSSTSLWNPEASTASAIGRNASRFSGGSPRARRTEKRHGAHDVRPHRGNPYRHISAHRLRNNAHRCQAEAFDEFDHVVGALLHGDGGVGFQGMVSLPSERRPHDTKSSRCLLNHCIEHAWIQEQRVQTQQDREFCLAGVERRRKVAHARSPAPEATEARCRSSSAVTSSGFSIACTWPVSGMYTSSAWGTRLAICSDLTGG